MTRTRLEVCVDTLEGLEIAAANGVDRIELCSCLSAGGMTPSLGIMRVAVALPCPTRVMIRPRDGDFTYSTGEIDMMLHEIDAVAGLGLDGVVIGANHLSGELDEAVLRRLTDHARTANLNVTLHRSFDLAPDLRAALAIAAGLGIDSVLTSGGALEAPKGIEALRDLVDAAHTNGNTLEIMAGVGVGSKTAREIVEGAGVDWLHGSCSRPRAIVSPEAQRLGYSTPDHRRTDATEITRLLAVLDEIAAARAASVSEKSPAEKSPEWAPK